MRIHIESWARHRFAQAAAMVTSADFVFVALDERRQPRRRISTSRRLRRWEQLSILSGSLSKFAQSSVAWPGLGPRYDENVREAWRKRKIITAGQRENT